MNLPAHRQLITTPNLTDPDAHYQLLLSAHEDLSDEDSAALNARLLLTLINHIGDLGVLRQAITLAKSTMSAR